MLDIVIIVGALNREIEGHRKRERVRERERGAHWLESLKDV